MSTNGGGGPSPKVTRHGGRGRVTRSVCRGLVREAALCVYHDLCNVHRRCALGFVENAIRRARSNGTRTLVRHATRSNPSLYAVHHGVDLHPLVHNIRGLVISTDTMEGRDIRDRVHAAMHRLLRRPSTPPGTVYLWRGVAERGEEDLHRKLGSTTPQ